VPIALIISGIKHSRTR